MRNRVIRSILKDYPNFEPSIIFDVGANIGQSCDDFLVAFPQCVIYAFEPVPETFEQLKSNTEGNSRIIANQIALGSSHGIVHMRVSGTSTGNKIISGSDRREDSAQVEAVRGDEYCRNRSISHIDFLKIDAEGHDLQVVMGFAGLLVNRSVRFVQVECSFSSDNRNHVAFDNFLHVFEAFGYGLYNIFDIVRRLPRTGARPGAVFGNAVFVKNG